MRVAACAEARGKAEALFKVLTGAEPGKGIRGFASAEGFAQFKDQRLLELTRALGISHVKFDGVQLSVFLGLGELWDDRRAGEIFNALASFDAVVLLDQGLLERLLVVDLEGAERLMSQLEKRVRAGHAEPKLLEALEAAAEALRRGEPASSLGPEVAQKLRGFNLATAKPLVIREFDWEFYAEALELGDDEILKALGDPVTELWQELWRAAGLIHFFTVKGGKATAWHLPEGSTALEAAARVHTDMAMGFAVARVARWDEVARAESFEAVARPAGKDYRVQDGDVLEFKFSK